jgi:hypothetical protein
MAVEIKADEALLWLRDHHVATVRLALKAMSLWRDLSECNSVISSSGGWDKTPVPIQANHRRIATDLAHIREALEARLMTEAGAGDGQ